jgi:small-conductance mechanosensitive channel
MTRFPNINLKNALLILGAVLLLGSSFLLHADDEPTGLSEKQRQALETLQNLVSLQENLKQDIEDLSKQIAQAKSDSQKQSLSESLTKLESDLDATEKNLENISAGIDLSALRDEEETKFDIQEELFGLLKPAIDEMKDMTSHIRQKSDLKERVVYYEERLKVIESALKNANNLLQQSESKEIKSSLSGMVSDWEKKRAFMQSELKSAQLQLDELLASEASITEASQSYLKSFFQKRGLYLIEALAVVLLIALLSRFSLNLMRRYMPGFKKKHRSFRTRLLELIHRIVTIFLVIVGPMVVFYVVEDWVLFSLSILLLLGIAWTLRQALPRYWHQIQLFLNIGSVREGERIEMDGLPWLVEQINVFCTLVNPTADLKQRVPIDDLVDLKSRPGKSDEPWFPCKLDDWVILSDGVRGKVIGISLELVQLVERGGAQKTYVTGDFLAASPRNLSTNFRLKEILGISYNLQKQSTGEIPEILQAYIQKQIEAEGYADQLLNLRVEFALANSSSLDLVVIADFDGQLGDLYNRLRRAIQRWCVDACTENDWEIPFPQMTLSGGVTLPVSGSQV